jgi:hypothetical protein
MSRRLAPGATVKVCGVDDLSRKVIVSLGGVSGWEEGRRGSGKWEMGWYLLFSRLGRVEFGVLGGGG